MIRRSYLWHPRPVLFLLLVTAAIPVPAARSQDRAIQDRLDRLERDLSMLQRQVYRGGSAQVIGTGNSAAVDTELRMDRLEAQMRELTGRVEDATNGLEQLRRRLEQVNSDIDVRLGQDQSQARSAPPNSHAAAGITDSSPARSLAMRGPSPGANLVRSRSADELMPPGTLVPPPPDPPGGAGTLTPPGPAHAKPEATMAAAGATLRPPSSALHSGSASEQYNFAFGLLKQADYPAAEEAFKAFIAQHPSASLAGSAQYWLGETYYARHRYAEAASAFAEGYKRYPKGPKAADDLLKLGMSLARANQKHSACVALGQLDHDFPNPGAPIRDQAAKEKKQLGC
ncbi:MAG: tol-pal system protein YbgF [Stellaceae bacterium]